MNAFLLKQDFEDRIIDLTIALESLVPGKEELRYRFALYLSFIAERDPARRTDRFALFRDLYDARSRIVHGSGLDARAEKKERALEEDLDELKRLSLSAMNYYLLFLGEKDHSKWQEHLQGLIVAGEKRLID